METGDMQHIYRMSLHVHATIPNDILHIHYFLACLGPHLSQIGLVKRDQSIYGIRGTCQLCLSKIFYIRTQGRIYECDILA